MANIGVVLSVTGTAESHADSSVQMLSEGSPVHVGETIETNAQSSVTIKFADNTQISQGPNSALTIQTYELAPKTGLLSYFGPAQAQAATSPTGQVHLQLDTGNYRIVAGSIAEDNPNGFRVSTPLADIGIRQGTSIHTIAPTGEELHMAEDLSEGSSLLITDNASNQHAITYASGSLTLQPEEALSDLSLQDSEPAASANSLESTPVFGDTDQLSDISSEDQAIISFDDPDSDGLEPVSIATFDSSEQATDLSSDNWEAPLTDAPVVASVAEEDISFTDAIVEMFEDWVESWFGDDVWEDVSEQDWNEEWNEEWIDDFYFDSLYPDPFEELGSIFMDDEEWEEYILADELYYDEEFVIIEGTEENDEFYGTEMDDAIFGLEGDDQLVANDGNDTLIGGLGNDTMFGSSSTFVTPYNTTATIFYYADVEEGGDLIHGFSEADKFRFHSGGFDGLEPSEEMKSMFQDIEFTEGTYDDSQLKSNKVRFVLHKNGNAEKGTHKLYYDENGSEAGGQTLIAEVDADLSEANFDIQ